MRNVVGVGVVGVGCGVTTTTAVGCGVTTPPSGVGVGELPIFLIRCHVRKIISLPKDSLARF